MTLVTTVLMVWVIKKYNATTGERNKMAAVGLFQHSAIQDKVRLAMHDDSSSQRHNVVEALRSTCEIVRGGHNRSTACNLCLKEIHDLLLRRWIHAGHGLVKEIEKRISSEGTRQEDSSSLPTGELADLATRQVEHVNSLQGISHRISVNATWAAQRAECRGAAHHHYLVYRDGEAPVHLLCLWHIGNTFRKHANWRTKDLDLAAPRLHQPSDALNERGLSTTIRPEDGRE
jgi:hypothetical protein